MRGRRVLGTVATVTTALGVLVGAGTAAGAAEDPGDVGFSVTPTAGLQFGDQPLAQSSEKLHFDVTVPGGWTLDDIDTQAGKGNVFDFQLDLEEFHECAGQAGPTPCEISYAFVPSHVGAESATAVFEFLQNGTTDVFQRIDRPLSGTGVLAEPGDDDYSITPTTVSFGSVELVPTPPPTASATLNVPAGLQVDAFGLGGSDPDDFTVDLTSPTGCVGVPGPITCQAVFTFSPSAIGPRSAIANFDASPVGGGPSQNVFVSLQGLGVANSASPSRRTHSTSSKCRSTQIRRRCASSP